MDDQRRSIDIVDTTRDLERQLTEQEAARAEEKRQLMARLETQRAEFDKENKELRERNAVVRRDAVQYFPVL